MWRPFGVWPGWVDGAGSGGVGADGARMMMIIGPPGWPRRGLSIFAAIPDASARSSLQMRNHNSQFRPYDATQFREASPATPMAASAVLRSLRVVRLRGTHDSPAVEYGAALQLQELLRDRRHGGGAAADGDPADCLLLLQHSPVRAPRRMPPPLAPLLMPLLARRRAGVGIVRPGVHARAAHGCRVAAAKGNTRGAAAARAPAVRRYVPRG